MTGVIGALVVLAVLLAMVLVLVVRPHARRAARAAGALRADLAVRLDRLAVVRSTRRAPSATAGATSIIGGHGRHRRLDTSP
jgi:alkylhydroperoxidase/carboxymuconolactone decarboxylase family protein YurZ